LEVEAKEHILLQQVQVVQEIQEVAAMAVAVDQELLVLAAVLVVMVAKV
jgi:hypothetical protein